MNTAEIWQSLGLSELPEITWEQSNSLRQLAYDCQGLTLRAKAETLSAKTAGEADVMSALLAVFADFSYQDWFERLAELLINWRQYRQDVEEAIALVLDAELRKSEWIESRKKEAHNALIAAFEDCSPKGYSQFTQDYEGTLEFSRNYYDAAIEQLERFLREVAQMLSQKA